MDVLCFILLAGSGALWLLHGEHESNLPKPAYAFLRGSSILLFFLSLLEILHVQGLWTTSVPSFITAGLLALSAGGLLFMLKRNPLPRPSGGDAILSAMIALSGAAIPWLVESIFIVFGLMGLLFLRVFFRFRKVAFLTEHRRKWLFPSCLTLLALIGVSLAAVNRQNSRAREMREELLRQSRAVANAISFNDLDRLLFTKADAQNPVYQVLSRQMADFARESGLKSIYSIARKDGKFFFGPESLPPGDPLSSPPGTPYLHPPLALFLSFLTGVPLTTGPYTDEYGTFVSAFVPIKDTLTHSVRLVVGMDIQTPNWNPELARARLAPLGFGLLCLFCIFGLQRILSLAREDAMHSSMFIVRHAHAFFIFLIGMVVTAYVSMSVSQEERNSKRSVFQELAMQRALMVQKKLLSIEQNELRALSRFYQSSETITPAEFQTFTRYLVMRPHVHSVMYAARISSGRTQEFESQIRMRNGWSDYRVYPDAGNTSERYPVFMAEPQPAQQWLLGYDLNAAAAIQEAIRFARATRSTALSEVFRLPMENGREESVAAMIRPMPSKPGAQEIFAVLFLRYGQLLDSIQERASRFFAIEQEPLVFIFDFYQIREGQHVFLETSRTLSPRESAPDFDHLLEEALPLPIFAYGNTYLLFCSEGPMFTRAHSLWSRRILIYFGSALSLAISLLVGLVLSWQQRIQRELERQRRGWRRSEEKFHQLVEKSPLAVVVLLKGRIQYANGAALQLLQLDERKDFFDMAFSSFVPEKFQERFDEILENLGDGGTSGDMDLMVANRSIPCEIHFVRIALDRDPGVLMFIRNLTEQIQAQQEKLQLQLQLEKSRKIESISRLANGVAHDFNNMLGVVLGASEMLLQQMPQGDPNRRDVLEIQSAAGRAADLVRRLLQFTRRQDGAAVLLDLNRKVQMDLSALAAPFSGRITFRWEPAESLWLVRIEPEQFSQILSILVKNACEAIENDGTVTIRTFNVVRAAPGAQQLGEFIVLSVSDTGCGMDSTILDHLFEPFFSTKKTDEHAGLGLALLHSIVVQAGGFVETESRPGGGSTFRVHFPKAFSVKSHASLTVRRSVEPPVHVPVAPGESVCVLYVDDEEANLRIAQRVLEKAGFIVHAAGSAREALQILETGGIRTLHVLVCDVALRDLPVMELVHAVKKKFPDIRLLFVSGYSYNALMAQGLLQADQEFLAKPFSGERLVQTLNELINQRTP